MIFRKYYHFYSDFAVVVVKVNYILIVESDTSFTVTSLENCFTVIGTSVDSDSLEAGCVQTHEPFAVGEDTPPPVSKIMTPVACILNLAYIERSAGIGFGGLHISASLFLSSVFGEADWIHCQKECIPVPIFIDTQTFLMYFRDYIETVVKVLCLFIYPADCESIVLR